MGIEESEPTSWYARLRQPRILLLLLAGWSIMGIITEFFTSSGLFVDLHGVELDGALGGRVLTWQGAPLAALYLHASRDPARFRGVFWIALIEQGAAVAANIYHLGAGDFSLESIVIPLVVSGSFGVLVFMHLFDLPGRGGVPTLRALPATPAHKNDDAAGGAPEPDVS